MTEAVPAQPRTALKSRLSSYGAAVSVGLIFGAGIQYLGSQSQTGAAISNLFAPWLLLAFVIGNAPLAYGRAALSGLAALISAVAGYICFILSPLEGVHQLTLAEATTVSWSQGRWLAAALVFGPLYGLLGQIWRKRRSRVAAIIAVVPFLAEAVAELAGFQSGQRVVSQCEFAAGICLALYFCVSALHHQRLSSGAPTART